MAFLAKARKAELQFLAEELGIEVEADAKLIELRNAICGSPDYDEEFVKGAVQSIIEERLAREAKQKEREAEQKEREAEEKKREAEEKKREAEERRHERQIEEMRLKLEHEQKMRELEITRNNGNNRPQGEIRNVVTGNTLVSYLSMVKDQLPKAPHKTENWAFFFHQAETIFEVYEVPEEYRGKIILHRLADFIRNLTNSLETAQLSNYNAIKESILAENRLTPLQHKANFEKCEKQPNESFLQWANKIKTSLDYYLESRGIKTLQEMKDLVVADKMKEMLPGPIRSHVLIKEGTKWWKPSDLAQEVDLFVEACPRNYFKKEINGKREQNAVSWTGREDRADVKPRTSEGKGHKSGVDGKRDQGFPNKKPEKFQPRCFRCNVSGHYKKDCPKAKSPNAPQEGGERQVKQVMLPVGINTTTPSWERVRSVEGEDELPTVELNIAGRKIQAIQDSGAQISVFRSDILPPGYREGGTVFLAPAFGEMQKASLVRIPVALWQENQIITPEVEILAAVTPKLNSPALITPAAYKMLVAQASVYQISVTTPYSQKGEADSKSSIGGNGDLTPSPERGEGSVNPPVGELPSAREFGGSERGENDATKNGGESGGASSDESEVPSTKSELAKLFRRQQKECAQLGREWAEARQNKNAYFIEDGLLYHTERRADGERKQLVVPLCRREEVIRLAHGHVAGAHMGPERTLERIKISFFWEGIRKQVKQYCSACEGCQLRRRTRVKDRAPIQFIARPELPFQVIHADLIGPIEPKSGRGHGYVLCIVDRHSRWPEAIPIRSLTAKATCEAFLQVFMRMGVPQVIVMDNGTNFASKLTLEFLKYMGAVPRFTTPGHPEGNGLVERWNMSIKNLLHHAIRDHGKDWDKVLPFLLWASREVTNDTVGISPFELVFGRAPSGPLALLRTCWEGETVMPEGIGQEPSEYLGYVVGSGEHGPDPEKLSAIRELMSPKTKKELRSVLGLFNYYREYVPKFAELAVPLTALTKKKSPNELPWTSHEEQAFQELKKKLCEAVELHTPDATKPFVITCDASELGVGASLGQANAEGKVMPVTFASKKLSETQRRWSAIEREAYAVIWALQKFETWVFGAKVQLYTDHNPLRYLTESAPRNPKLQRWLLALQRYDVTINYKPGAKNLDADALSRLSTHSGRKRSSTDDRSQ